MQDNEINVEDLSAYILIGLDKDNKHVQALSANLSMGDAAMFIGRLQFNLQVQALRSVLMEHDQAPKLHGPGGPILRR